MTPPNDEALWRLAEAVADRAPVEWEREAVVNAALQPQLRRLRILEAVTALHRRAVPDPLIGTRLSHFQILEKIGEGGMGVVYRAGDKRLRRQVALKVLPPELVANEERRLRFLREARAAAAVTHPNIATIYDVGEGQGVVFIAMELLEGETLRELVSRRSPTQRQILSFAIQIAHGLEAAHSKGIVHRDLKPENLIVTTDGRVKILDFGLAKLVSREQVDTEQPTATAATRPGQLLGTPRYMSPEQVRGLPADHRSDIFSFGVLLYEVLAQKHPFRRDTALATLSAILEETPPELSSLGRGVPLAVGGIVRRCLEKAREDRFPSAHDLAVALETVLAAPAGSARLQEVEEQSPYPGLSSFTERDAAFFFGREGEVAALWRRLRERRILAVIGPSGAGKTSFMRAGVMASRPEGWGALVCTPGAAPLRGLGQALAPELSGDPGALRKLVGFDDPETAFELVSLWRKHHGEALLVVDQFEELFTLNPPEVQGRFADLLGRLAHEGDVHVLLSLRDDFLIRCSEQEPLAPIFLELTPLPALSREGLRRALVEPAQKRGCRFEDEALVEEMLTSVEGARAALPLLAFAVSRLWERRDREMKVLTREAYEEIGGVAGALAQHAEAALDQIGSERQGIVREIFRNLVTSLGTRAVADRKELLSAFPDRKGAEAVLGKLIDARLLTSYEVEEVEGKPSRRRVEIVHESLLKAWPRLVRWQAQDEEGALLRDQLKQAVHLWEEKGRPADLLWSGTAYQEFKLWRERYPGSLTVLEEDFARSMEDKARRKKRLVRLALSTAFLMITAIAIAIGISRHQATSARDQARSEALRAESSKLLALAELRLREDPTEALAFTIASLEQADTDEARTFAMKALWEAPPAFELIGGSQAVKIPTFSPDGKWLAAAGHSAEVRVWSEDGRGPLVLPGHETSPRGGNRARWASNGLLVTGAASMVGSRVHLWSLPEGRHVRTIDFGRPSSWQVGPQRLLAETLESGSAERPSVGLLRSWALPDGEPVVQGRVDWRKLGTQRTFFAPDGTSWLYARDRNLYSRPLPVGGGPDRLLARLGAEVAEFTDQNSPDQLVVADRSGQTHVWSFSPRGPPRRRVIPKPDTASYGMLPDPSGRWLSGYPDQQVLLWDLAAWPAARPWALRRNESWYNAIASFHPTGDWVVASTAHFTRLTFWPLGKTYPSVVDGYASHFRPVAFSPDGKWLATVWDDQRLRLWPLPGSGVSEVRSLDLPETSLIASLAFDPKGRYLFAVGNQDRAWVVPLDGSAPRKLQGFSEDTLLHAAAVSPSGRLVATAFFYGRGEKTLRVWNLETGELRRFDLPESQGTVTGGNEARLGPTGYERGIVSVAFADDSTLYTAGDGGLRRWNLESGSHELVAATSPGYGMRGSLSADRRVALTVENHLGQAENCPRALLHNLTAGTSRQLTEFGECGTWRMRAVALDPSGSVAAAGSLDGIVRVGRLSGGEPHLLVGHKGAVDSIVISPDLRWLATSGEDNTLRLWPMPDLSKPPLHALPHDELLAKLRSLTNLRVVRDPSSATGWKVEVGPFPGWKDVPTW